MQAVIDRLGLLKDPATLSCGPQELYAAHLNFHTECSFGFGPEAWFGPIDHY